MLACLHVHPYPQSQPQILTIGNSWLAARLFVLSSYYLTRSVADAAAKNRHKQPRRFVYFRGAYGATSWSASRFGPGESGSNENPKKEMHNTQRTKEVVRQKRKQNR